MYEIQDEALGEKALKVAEKSEIFKEKTKENDN
jgi:hypothetical protein